MIDAGNTHTIALRNDGKLIAWGDNRAGQLAIPRSYGTVIAISAGYEHTLVVTR